MDKETPLEKALLSLEGLSTRDAFGELFFRLSHEQITPDDLPPGPWRWTDYTHMALSIVEVLEKYDHIEQDALACAFARRFSEEPFRGYGSGAKQLLALLSMGEEWCELSPRLFGGGSFGNGAAMRAAPIGGYFHGDPERAAREARLSAVVTHAHPEGQAGAVAAASAAGSPCPPGAGFLDEILLHVPEGLTKEGIRRGSTSPPTTCTLQRWNWGQVTK